MKVDEIESSCSFRCSHCENSEEIFSSLLNQKKGSAKVWIRNLPNGLSESGLKNLFLTIGNPKAITYYVSSNSAIAEFDSTKQVDLTVRDLHEKSPYNLKVSTGPYSTKQPTEDTTEENWDFSDRDNVLENSLCGGNKTEERHDKSEKPKSQSEDTINKYGYDPSIRMRQKKLDFKTPTKCISMGRGYLNMGEINRYIGGLKNFTFASKNSKVKEEVNFTCEVCQAPTTKLCGYCLKSYCSKVCLNESEINHQGKCSMNDKIQEPLKKTSVSSQENLCFSSSEYLFFNGELTPGCTVIMSSYLTMDLVYVRKSDKDWEEKFTRLCNDVAESALNDGKLQSIPIVGEIYAGKYYKDFCFYRARVTSLDENKANVIFIDFGNSQETNFDDLKPLPRHLAAVPELAVKVQLSDMSEGSSPESVYYYNKLTAERIPLILEFKNEYNEVVLKEKDSKAIVNETAANYSLPSWKRDSSILSKAGEVLFKNELASAVLKVGGTCNLTLCHFEENEFLDSDVLWTSLSDTDDFVHVNSEMQHRITEYCEYLENDYYLPRTNELCLVKEAGKWHRCINLKSQKTLCCVFFVDDGHSSFIESCDIRKMIRDFIEVPGQAICCTLPDDSKLKADKELCSKVVEYLKSCVGQTINSIRVLKMMGDAYCLSVPEIQKILA